MENKIIAKENEFPDVLSYMDNGNPTLTSPNSSYELPLYQTKDSFMDVELYSKFIHNAISQFRRMRVYKNYKAYLMNIGLDHCQYLHNINSSMAELEMNHCILTIFDVAVLISEHIINTYGYITTPHLVAQLRYVHSQNLVPLTMMSKTVHQLYHNDDMFYTHPNQVFGQWVTLLNTYNRGITPEICTKVLYYIRTAFEEGESSDNGLLSCATTIKNWSENVYGSYINRIPDQNPFSM